MFATMHLNFTDVAPKGRFNFIKMNRDFVEEFPYQQFMSKYTLAPKCQA